MALKVDKKGRLAGRIFSVVCTLFAVQMLFDGGYHYTSMGHAYHVSAEGDPLKFYLSLLWFIVLAVIGTYFGFIARVKE